MADSMVATSCHAVDEASAKRYPGTPKATIDCDTEGSAAFRPASDVADFEMRGNKLQRNPRCISGKLLAGLVLLVIQLACQQAINEFLEFQERHTSLNVPMVTIYMNHSWLLFLFPAAWIFACAGQRKCVGFLQPLLRFWKGAREKISKTRILLYLLGLSFLYLVPNVAWALSIDRVSVTLSLAVQQSACIFVYFLEFCSGKTTKLGKFWWMPIVAIFACMAGVVLVCVGQADEGSAGGPKGKGDIRNFLLLAVFPICIAAYDVSFSHVTQKLCRSIDDVLVFISLIGLVNILTCWPVIWVAGAFGFEDAFALPMPFTLEGNLFYGGSALATGYNFAFMVGLNFLGPIFISIASILQLPVSAASDLLLHGIGIGPLICIGGVCIAIGFMVLTLQEQFMSRLQSWRPRPAASLHESLLPSN